MEDLITRAEVEKILEDGSKGVPMTYTEYRLCKTLLKAWAECKEFRRQWEYLQKSGYKTIDKLSETMREYEAMLSIVAQQNLDHVRSAENLGEISFAVLIYLVENSREVLKREGSKLWKPEQS